MSDLSSTSYGRDTSCDNSLNPMMLILLLCLCGGDSGLLGGCGDKNGCGGNNGLSGILPIILILSLCGGSF